MAATSIAGAVLVVTAGVQGVHAVPLLADQPPPGTQLLPVLVGVALALTATALVVAAPALVIRAEVAASRWGCSLVVLGALCSAEVTARVLTHDQPASVAGTLTRLVGTVMCLALVTAAHRGWRSPWRPGLEAAVVAGVLGVVFVGLLGAQVLGAGPWQSHAYTLVVVELVSASGWTGMAIIVALSGAHRAGPHVSALPAVVAAAHLCLAAEAGEVTRLTLGATGVSLVTAVWVARASWQVLLGRLRAERVQHDAEREALIVARSLAAGRAARLADVTHDARNACLGVRAAIELLCRDGARLDHAQTETLKAAALSGVGQLEHVVATTSEPSTVAADVVAVAQDLVRTQRLLGHDVTMRGSSSGVVAAALAGEIARIVVNLLTNAVRHGDGAPILVEVDAVGASARVTVSDLGPGIETAHADRVFERAERGRTSSGDGLGLPIARALARSRGGELRLVPAVRGARFELLLPLTSTSSSVATALPDVHDISAVLRVPAYAR